LPVKYWVEVGHNCKKKWERETILTESTHSNQHDIADDFDKQSFGTSFGTLLYSISKKLFEEKFLILKWDYQLRTHFYFFVTAYVVII